MGCLSGCFGGSAHYDKPAAKHQDRYYRDSAAPAHKEQALDSRASPPQAGGRRGAAPLRGEARYALVGELGQGRTGTIKLMQDRNSGDLVAVKYVDRILGAGLHKNTEREILNHRKLLHPNIVRFREVFITETNLAIVMEYASGGSLAERLRTARVLPEPQARAVFAQLIAGIHYCHQQGVFHRSLQLNNILFDGSHYKPVVKISNFGYSKSAVLDSQPKTAVAGSPAYTPPEQLTMGPGDAAAYDGEKVDVWACGVILYAMLCGTFPFMDASAPHTLTRRAMRAICECDWRGPASAKLSPGAQDLLSQIFVADPAQRAGVAALGAHPWVQDRPAAHGFSAPASPQQVAPATPLQMAPASPQQMAPASMQQVAPASPQRGLAPFIPAASVQHPAQLAGSPHVTPPSSPMRAGSLRVTPPSSPMRAGSPRITPPSSPKQVAATAGAASMLATSGTLATSPPASPIRLPLQALRHQLPAGPLLPAGPASPVSPTMLQPAAPPAAPQPAGSLASPPNSPTTAPPAEAPAAGATPRRWARLSPPRPVAAPSAQPASPAGLPGVTPAVPEHSGTGGAVPFAAPPASPLPPPIGAAQVAPEQSGSHSEEDEAALALDAVGLAVDDNPVAAAQPAAARQPSPGPLDRVSPAASASKLAPPARAKSVTFALPEQPRTPPAGDLAPTGRRNSGSRRRGAPPAAAYDASPLTHGYAAQLPRVTPVTETNLWDPPGPLPFAQQPEDEIRAIVTRAVTQTAARPPRHPGSRRELFNEDDLDDYC